ncbi:MAG: type IV pilus biogenesis/stability protein PilW [Gammaproteobacteria bacterium]
MTPRTAALVLAGLLAACTAPGRQDAGGVRPAYNPNRLAEINVQLGVEYMNQGNNEAALNKLEKALALDPNYPAAHSTLGILYNRLGEDGPAEKHFAAAVRAAPNDSDALNNYGQFLCQKKRISDALDKFDRAVKNPLYDTPAVAYTNAGICAYQGGDLDTADARLRAALQSDDAFPPALLYMARVSLERAQALQARGYLQRYEAAAQQPSASSLWLGARIERALNNTEAAQVYERDLRSRFPDSSEVRDLQSSGAK